MSEKLFFSALVLLAMIFWGASWPASKLLVEIAPPFVIMAWRFTFAFVAGAVICALLRISIRISLRDFWFLLIAGLLNALYSIFFFFGLTFGSAGRGGVLATTMSPVFAYLLVFTLRKLKEKRKINQLNPNSISSSTKSQNAALQPKKSEIIGVCIGILAGLLLLNPSAPQELFGIFNSLFLLAALDWAILSQFTALTRAHPVAINLYTTAIAALCFAPLLLFSADSIFVIFSDFNSLAPLFLGADFWAPMLVVSVLSTALGTSIYYLGVAQLGVARAASFMLLVPIFALLGSYFVLGEVPNFWTIFGGSLAIFAIYLINIYGRK